MRLTSQNQTIGNFFIGKDRILDISAVQSNTARQLLQIPPGRNTAHQYLVLKRHQEVCFCDISKVVSRHLP
jgi:hypothetical protein